MPSLRSYTFKIPCDRTEAVEGDVIVVKYGETGSLYVSSSIYTSSSWSSPGDFGFAVTYDKIGSTKYAVVTIKMVTPGTLYVNLKATYIKA